MNKYVIKVIVVPLDIPTYPATIPLPDTNFVAVSAYQSMDVTQMKINYNPYAKAFKYRENKNLALLDGPSTSAQAAAIPANCIVTVPQHSVLVTAPQQHTCGVEQLQVSGKTASPQQALPQGASAQQISVLQGVSRMPAAASKHVSVLQRAPVLKNTSRTKMPRKAAAPELLSAKEAVQLEPPSLTPDEPDVQEISSDLSEHELVIAMSDTEEEVATSQPVMQQRGYSKPTIPPLVMEPTPLVAQEVSAPPMFAARQPEPPRMVLRQIVPPHFMAQRPAAEPVHISQFGTQRCITHRGSRRMIPQQLAQHMYAQQVGMQQAVSQDILTRQLFQQQQAAHAVPPEVAAEQLVQHQMMLQQIGVQRQLTPEEMAAGQLYLQQQLIQHQQNLQRSALQQLSPEEQEEFLQRQQLPAVGRFVSAQDCATKQRLQHQPTAQHSVLHDTTQQAPAMKKKPMQGNNIVLSVIIK
jgi:hypothetical protein